MPRIAFCFHHSQPSGATLWLKRFLDEDIAPIEAEAIFPADSSVAEHLRSIGIPVHVLGLRERAITEAGAVDAAKLVLNRIGTVSRYREIFRKGRFDAAYVNTSVNIAPMIAARRTGLPFLVHVHEIPTAARAFAAKRMLIRRWADACLFASQEGIRAFGPGAPVGKRWEFSPNGVPMDLATLRERRTELRNAKGFRDGETVVLFAGNLSVSKGVHLLLQAWKDTRKKFPSARLLLAGPHDPAKGHPLIDELLAGTIDSAEALGFRGDLPELMAAADLFVLPSLSEAMPLSIIEAMMIGTPVIASDVGDVGWLLGGERGVVYRKESELAGTLENALAGRSDMARHAQNAREFAMSELTNARQNTQVIAMIRDVVEKRPPGGRHSQG
ncbi:glycosyltransferase family 4 protein [Candidatus Sumerlaeota bacterium]|nr:glycosyltransferase family 4 protein [Candidatus Sumerlaeota bacterium]